MPDRNKMAKNCWSQLNQSIVQCQKCPRLVAHTRQVAIEKRRAYANENYWGQPVPNFGSGNSELLIVGLAPGAHGANRTGRMFTGDRSGDWLYRALNRGGFASQPVSRDVNDGLKLSNCTITSVCHCAPPQNKVTAEEVANCRDYLISTVDFCNPRVVLALGQLAWNQMLRLAQNQEWLAGPKPKFAHSAETRFANGVYLLGSYHPSQQNTFTGRLTEAMLDSVIDRANSLIAAGSGKRKARRRIDGKAIAK